MPTIEDLAESIYEANLFFPVAKQTEKSSEFIQFVFQEFGKLLIRTMELEMMANNEIDGQEDQATPVENEEEWSVRKTLEKQP